MLIAKVAHPSVKERRTKGKDARELTPLASHGGWATAPDRPDPVALLEAQNRHSGAGSACPYAMVG